MSDKDYQYTSKLNTGRYEILEDAELFEDGELKNDEVYNKVINRVFYIGDWVVMR